MLIKSMRMQVRVCNKYMHALLLATLPCRVIRCLRFPTIIRGANDLVAYNCLKASPGSRNLSACLALSDALGVPALGGRGPHAEQPLCKHPGDSK